MLKLKSATEGVALEMFEGLEPILRGIIQGFTDFMSAIDMEKLKAYGTSIGTVAGAWWLYTYGQRAATFATKNFKKALIATGIGAFAVALGWVIDKMNWFGDETDEAVDALNEESKAVMNSVTMFAAYGKDKDKQLEIITKLKEEYPEYYGHIDAETASVKELKKATDMYLKVEMQKVVLDQFQEERVELVNKQAAGLKKVIEAQASSAKGLQHYNDLLGLGIREYGNLDEVTGAWTNFNTAMTAIGGNVWAHKELFHTTFGEMFEGYNQNGDNMLRSQKNWLDEMVGYYAVALGVMDKETGKQLEGYDEFISSISDKTPRELASLFGGEDNIQEMGQDTVYVWRKLRDANKEYQEVLSETTPDVERLAEAEKDLMLQLEKLQEQLFKTDPLVPGQNGDNGKDDDPVIKVLTQEEIDENLAKIAEYNESEMEMTAFYREQKLIEEMAGQLALADATIKNETELEAAKLQIQETFWKKKKKLDKAEEKASKAKTDAIIGHSVQLINTIVGVWKTSGKNIEMTANLQYIAAIADTYRAASAAFAKGGGVPGGILPMTLSIAQGMAQVAQIAKARDEAKAAASQSVEAEYGANFVTDGLTNLTVGDNPGGQELVNVTPLSSPNMFGDPDAVGGGGQTINVQIEGGLISSDFVEGELAEKIADGVRRGVDFGINQ